MPFFGKSVHALLGITYLKNCALEKRLIVALIDGQKLGYGRIFLAYTKKLIRNEYLQTEAMFAVTSMQMELGVVKIEQLDEAVAAQLQGYTYPVMPMNICFILKSLVVMSTTVKLQVN